ncbi:MAG: LysM peptidoglycan-binding domain-containing protein [Bacteroidales bacterium]|nr:LysM peptidoglycan-binding domain-containing protein [Bacteroidales bacterium]
MKKFFVLIMLFASLTSVAQTINIPISTNIQTREGKLFYIHTVQKGQTVYSISKAYNISIAQLYQFNPHARNGIQIGQQLTIPDNNQPNSGSTTTITSLQNNKPKEVTLKSFDFFYHVAAPGESIAHVSSIYLVPEKYILLANPGLKGPLKEGQYIKIPVEDAYKILDAEANGTTATTNSNISNTVTHIKVPAPPKPKPVKTTFKLPESSSTQAKQNSSTAQTQTEVPFIKNYQHVVIPGETMQSIAKKYDITVSELKSVNPGLVMILQGQRLRLPTNAKVPGYQPTTPAKINPAISDQVQTTKSKKKNNKPTVQDVNSNQFIQHTVKKGETLYSISRKYGISLNDLYKENKNLTTNIKVGQVILIPKKKMNEPYVFFTPESNTRLKKIARLYKIDFDLLKQQNPTMGNRVQPGEIVKIPVETFNSEKAPLSPGKEEMVQTKTEQKPQQESTLGCTPIPHTAEFKVALMVPLYLNLSDSINPAQFLMQDQKNYAPFAFIKFLQGGLLATELMKQQGMDVQLYVFDVDQQLSKTDSVLLNPELKNMNLIIGPFYSRPFSMVSAFASANGIPIINPLTIRNEVLDQDHSVVKVQPGTKYQLPIIRKYIQENQDLDKIFVIHQGNITDDSISFAISDTISKILPQQVKFSNTELANLGVAVNQREKEKARQDFLKLMAADPNHEIYPADTVLPPVVTTLTDTLQPYVFENTTIFPDSLKLFNTDSTTFSNQLININYDADSLHPFVNNASVLRKNLVIVYGTSKAFVMDVMNRLNVIRDTFNIRLIGMPYWEDFTEMDYNQMNNLKLVYPSSYYVNHSASETKDMDSLFVKKFGSLPEKFGNLGFDITYYFLNTLYYMGNQVTTCAPNYPYSGISSHFELKPEGANGNLENSFWYLLQIKNMQLYNISNPGFMNHPSPLLPENHTQQ